MIMNITIIPKSELSYILYYDHLQFQHSHSTYHATNRTYTNVITYRNDLTATRFFPWLIGLCNALEALQCLHVALVGGKGGMER